MKITDKEKEIVLRAIRQDPKSTVGIAEKAGTSHEDLVNVKVGREKTHKAQRIIDTCRDMLEDDLKKLKEMLDRD